MTSKKHPIEILEKALEYERDQLATCQEGIKSLRNKATKNEGLAMTSIARITGLEDAIHKLKGLDNLEKKSIPDHDIEEKLPASMEKNLQRVEMARLYGRSVLSFSKEELAAYIIYQSDKMLKILEQRR